MAQVTEHLGFGVTCNLSYEPPYPFARRMSTLDHLTRRADRLEHRDRLPRTARRRGIGMDAQNAHDDRYDIADEYMEVVYKLWEGELGGRRGGARPRATASSPTRQGP